VGLLILPVLFLALLLENGVGLRQVEHGAGGNADDESIREIVRHGYPLANVKLPPLERRIEPEVE
jgi:hypothetical protein